MAVFTRARAVYIGEARLGALGIETCLANAGHELLTACYDPGMAPTMLDVHQPNLVLIGALRPAHRAFELCRALARIKSEGPVILSTRRPSDELVVADAAYAGAHACVDSNIGCDELLDVIERVLVGATLFTPEQTCLAYSVEELTLRQRELLRLVAEGLSTSEIASELGISAHTVRNIESEIRSKLSTSTTRAAAVRAQRRGMI